MGKCRQKRASYLPRVSVRHFFAPFRLISRHARRARISRQISVKTLVRGKTSQDCVRRLPFPPPALNTIFFLQRATRRKFSAKALMLTNACQLLYLIPRLSLSLLSLPFFNLNMHLFQTVKSFLLTMITQQTRVSDKAYPNRGIFYSCGREKFLSPPFSCLPPSLLSSICLLTNWPNKPGHCVHSRRVVHLNLGSPFFARYRRRYRPSLGPRAPLPRAVLSTVQISVRHLLRHGTTNGVRKICA